MPRAPLSSVRGRVRQWIERNAALLGDDVLEVGARQHRPGCWWLNNRDLAKGQWLGVDMQPGLGVDQVVDMHRPPAEWHGRFSAVLCSEVLEHVARPWVALPAMRQVIRPGGHIVITTLTCFPVHGYPDDFYRYTESGLRLLLEDAGFTDVCTAGAGAVNFVLNDHGEAGQARRTCPMHVFAVAQVPPAAGGAPC